MSSLPNARQGHQPRRAGYWLQFALTAAVCLFMTAPVVLSVLAGLTNNIFIGLASGLTTRWLGEVWALYRGTIFLSLGIALACLACTLVLGVPAAYYMALRRGRLTRLVEELLMLPVAVPGLATALGLILLYGGWAALRTSWVFILIGHVLFTLPFMVRAVLAVLSAIDVRTLEDAAASLGASRLQRFFGVVLPNCRQGILAGALMVVTLSVGEFNLTWMLHTPTTQTLPVGLADSYASMRLEIGSAYTIVFFLMIIPLLVLMQALSAAGARARKHRAPMPDAAGEATSIAAPAAQLNAETRHA
ncbi:ABC transporter permease [Cupriavidus sp. USMAHM13]|uniref:ABC transporter permease n=1 Tax=Cupriavidus malaysiensis TaxID=367825 RepID=A0ABN4TRM9_9BURK|nr:MULTISPECIES: ABC transporter permease [Cupriavidus]AOZ02920.1 ABC transporter permease [Cupriavidus sp. USMAHM13]AOZ09708.1 ABC transporter permease [Cupriavidus malaysiensis]